MQHKGGGEQRGGLFFWAVSKPCSLPLFAAFSLQLWTPTFGPHEEDKLKELWLTRGSTKFLDIICYHAHTHTHTPLTSIIGRMLHTSKVVYAVTMETVVGRLLHTACSTFRTA